MIETTATTTTATTEVVTPRRRGRPPGSGRKPKPVAATPAMGQDWNPQWEEFGGDLDALAAWTKRSGVPFSAKRDFRSRLPSLQPRGTFICRADPTLCFSWAWLEEDGSKHTIGVGQEARANGYRIATSDEFALNPKLRGIIVPDSANRYVVPDLSGKSTAVVLVRDKAAWLAARDERLRFSNEIQISAQERMAEQQDKYRSAGINAVTKFEVEDTDKF